MACASLVLTSGCQSQKDVVEGAAAELESKEGGEDLSFLMTMTWEEAKGLSAQSLEVPPFFRLTADKIEVLKANPDGTARRVRARGKVFIEMQFADLGRVLCQEAFLTDDELILRGKPLLQRGGSAVSGLDDATVFYMMGPRLKVIGRHRVIHEKALLAEWGKVAMNESTEGVGGSGFAVLGSPPTLPIMSGPWAGGPNPLLPPLTSASVPEEVRMKMRAEAEAVKVLPLETPQESAVGPPMSLMAPQPNVTVPKSAAEDSVPLLPVPVKSKED